MEPAALTTHHLWRGYDTRSGECEFASNIYREVNDWVMEDPEHRIVRCDYRQLSLI